MIINSRFEFKKFKLNIIIYKAKVNITIIYILSFKFFKFINILNCS